MPLPDASGPAALPVVVPEVVAPGFVSPWFVVPDVVAPDVAPEVVLLEPFEFGPAFCSGAVPGVVCPDASGVAGEVLGVCGEAPGVCGVVLGVCGAVAGVEDCEPAVCPLG